MPTVIASLVATALVIVAVVLGVLALTGRSAKQSASETSQPATSWTQHPTSSPPGTGLMLKGLVTDEAHALERRGHLEVEVAVRRLLDARNVKLWVVYVKDFGGLKPGKWAKNTMHANGFTDQDVMLAIATDEHTYSFDVPPAVIVGKPINVEEIRRSHIEPAVQRGEWVRAATEAANGLNAAPDKPR